LAETDDCKPGVSNCSNVPGGFECVCVDGYEMFAGECHGMIIIGAVHSTTLK